MQAIVTKYIGPTNFKGGRIKATAQAGSIILPWDHALNADGNHCAAARALALKFGWTYGTWQSGYTEDGHGVWVCLDKGAREGQECFTLTEPLAA